MVLSLLLVDSEEIAFWPTGVPESESSTALGVAPILLPFNLPSHTCRTQANKPYPNEIGF